jgi:hypothetical protein
LPGQLVVLAGQADGGIMKYALLIYAAPGTSPLSGTEARQAWLDFATAARDAGVLLGAERLADTDTATSVRLRGGERLLTDGPFMETKEHLLGLFLIDAPDLDAALEWAAKMPHAVHGTAEVRAVSADPLLQAVLG